MSSKQPEKFLKVNIDLKELDSTYETQASTVISKFSYTSCNNVLDFSNEDNYIEALDDAMKEMYLDDEVSLYENETSSLNNFVCNSPSRGCINNKSLLDQISEFSLD